MSFALIDDCGHSTTLGYVKHHNRKSRKILKRDHAKRNRQHGKSLDTTEIKIRHTSTQMYLETRGKMEKDHDRDQRQKDIDRRSIRRPS